MCITGHIYKIIHLDSSITYIGSTCDSISGRWRTHKKAYKTWLNNKEKFNPVAIYPYFEQYGIERFKMIQIKSYELIDKTHLRVYEQLAVNRTKCCNINAAMQLISTACMAKHYRQSLSEPMKEYRQANKEKISNRMKQYNEVNRDKISEYKKSYDEQNKQFIKEKRSVKVTCECGSQVSKSCLARHKKTQKHLTLLAALSN